ncbi:LuxR C-terminal-related transcriptional regulator [Streptomyces sp. NBC_01275]|uniref:LuxR family transcriptional regulator n=1 Tax=Streptomyces sp. NBC_01275 TaxID=2903807 RepID=UPI002258E0F6|nr:LuxR family transcriptional regulator [Streptomyces sp. NBC_01275]MCX4760349.1 LuxR C-terminal-related transcriptional regulator [Streptomyces sp. NBC_01275]
MVTPVNPPPLGGTSPPTHPDACPRPASALPEGVRVRVLRLVYGDPRAAAELAARLTERQASGLDPLPTEPATLAPGLLRAYRGEIRALPDDTRLLLLLAAADQYPVATHAFLRAVAAARLDTRPLEAAEAAGIAYATAGGVCFRDAWTRIAVHETATPADRRDVHRLLARVLHDQAETPRRSWHRGAGALGPSARLAAELTAAAAQARAAGDPALSAALVERAAELSPDARERARLLARAAADAWHSGDGDRARDLAARTDVPALSGVLALRTGHAGEAFDALLAGAVRAARAEARAGAEAGEEAEEIAAEPPSGGAPSAELSSGGTTSVEPPSGRASGGRASAGAAGPSDGPVVVRAAGESSGPAPAGAAGRPSGRPLPGAVGEASPRSLPTDPTDTASHLLARATEAAVYTGDLRRCREAVLVARRLGVVPPGALGGIAAAVDGRYEDARDLLEATAGRCGPGGDPTLLLHAGIAALMLGDHTRAATATLRAAAAARARGITATVSQAMEFRAYADFWTGRPHAAEAAALDALRQAYTTGQDNGACHLQAALAMFAAVTGDADLCRARAAAARSYALAHGLGLPAALAQWALAFLDLGAGRFGAAAARLRALAAFGPGHGHRAIRHLATPHYVEAAARAGDTRVARAAHADYDRWARAVRSPDDLALSARCRALLTPGADAVEHYRTALDLHADGTRAFERARTELLFGSALRRLRQRAEARDRLHSALEAFESFGAPHHAEGARAELRALGAPAAPARGRERPTAQLTAQQLLVSRMAADGATNREIAARLALSPRTIDHHLRGVFTRLGIRSRIELVRLLAEDDGG